MKKEKKIVTIEVTEQTLKKLEKFGKSITVWDIVINKLLDHAWGCKEYWEKQP